MYIFGAFLLYTGFKLFFQKEDEDYNPANSKIYQVSRKLFRLTDVEPKGRFIISAKGKIYFTTLSMVVLMLAATDIVFALDSIPTVVSLVREKADIPFSPDDILVIYSSNIFAVLGLRSLFFLLQGAVDKFGYLQQGSFGIYRGKNAYRILRHPHFHLYLPRNYSRLSGLSNPVFAV
jgi:tellurite resistance protein TerC